MLTLHVPDEVETRLAPIAQAAGKTAAAYVNETFAEYLQDLEDVCEAEQCLADIRSGKVKALTSDQLRKELGLDD